MVYSNIQPPFTLQFREMPKAELKVYFDWFMSQIPVRLPILEAAVKATPGFENWSADFTPESLKALGNWFATQVETRPYTEEELTALKQGVPSWVPIDDYQLTNKTFSLAVDIAMYWSEVFKRNFPSLRWDQILKGKRDINYGQPVLVGFGIVPLNPVRVMIVLAHQFILKTEVGTGLFNVHNHWASKVG